MALLDLAFRAEAAAAAESNFYTAADSRPHGLATVGARARLTFVCVPRCLPGTKPRVEVRKVIKTHTGPRGRPARRRGP